MQQEIRFCTAPDGIQIAYALAGEGPPLVRVLNWMTHLEYERTSPVWRHWLAELSSAHTLVRYDGRGCGLSDWEANEFTLDRWVQDLESVVDALALTRFPLLGLCRGAAIAAAYAVKHPERVSHLILYGGYARGRSRRGPEQAAKGQMLLKLIELGWGQDNPAFRQVYTTLFIPDGNTEQIEWFNDLQRISTAPEIAAQMQAAAYELDVSNLARKVRAPTLVMHAQEDAVIPFAEGRLLATLIPGAKFVPLDSRNHILLEHEPAWQQFLSEIRTFLIPSPSKTSAVSHVQDLADLSDRERAVLDLIARGLDNGQIAERLVISPKTVRNHITSIFSKLQVANRAQAIVMARDAGFGLIQ